METVLIESDGKAASDVVIGAGLLLRGGAAEILPDASQRRRVALFTQPAVADLSATLAERLSAEGLTVSCKTLPDRDSAKTMVVVEECYSWLNGLGLTRFDTIVAVGGGALTDVAGFVAATYLRGVEAVLVPTTLVGAVDAAIGGKSGVNVGGKNLAGVFRHPTRIVVDTTVLERLPAALVREGSAEALKAGLIADPELVALYQRHGLDAPLPEVVERAVRVKARIVSDDFTESGRRAVLNYGHTVGHALEAATGMSHGHAVSVGIVAAGAASAQQLGFQDQQLQVDLLADLGLPTAAPGGVAAEVRALLKLDKKRDADGLRMVLLDRIGSAGLHSVGPATVDAALASVGLA